MTKKRLEILLEGCGGFTRPKEALEQYVTPTPIVAEVLSFADMRGDIHGRSVYDLGCGTGRFAIGAALLGARKVVGVDADPRALEDARENARALGVAVEWVLSDIKDIKGECDTVIQNPPFGVRRPGADRAFLEKALEMAGVVYSIHKGSTREFIYAFVEKIGGRITDRKEFRFSIPHTYQFHRKEKKVVGVDVYRIEVN
ncbi:MAG: methyltransferase [Euryarchaeota archaeon]|nr:methyltransferase [Euryarchaeota archaeon]